MAKIKAPGWLRRAIQQETGEGETTRQIPATTRSGSDPTILTGTEMVPAAEPSAARPTIHSPHDAAQARHPAVVFDLGDPDRLSAEPAGALVQVTDQTLLGVTSQRVVPTTRAYEPALIILDPEQFGDDMDDDTAADYVAGIIESAIGLTVDGVGEILEADRKGRFVCVEFQTALRRKSYGVVIPVERIAQPVAQALTLFWQALQEKASQESVSHQDFERTNRLIDQSVALLQAASGMLGPQELVFLQGKMQKEKVLPGAPPKRRSRRRHLSKPKQQAKVAVED